MPVGRVPYGDSGGGASPTPSLVTVPMSRLAALIMVFATVRGYSVSNAMISTAAIAIGLAVVRASSRASATPP